MVMTLNVRSEVNLGTYAREVDNSNNQVAEDEMGGPCSTDGGKDERL
jgi:hypothetical protein